MQTNVGVEAEKVEEATFVIVGGGIAGVTCAETLAFYQPEQKILLLTESSLIKKVVNLHAITQNILNFDIIEAGAETLTETHPNVIVLNDSLAKIDDINKTIRTVNQKQIKYQFLCLCTGGKPKLINEGINNDLIMGIRDTDSVESFLKKLKTSKRVAIVGNGGIASELVYKIKNAHVDWIIKDKHTTATFIDVGAAEFLKNNVNERLDFTMGPSKRMRYQSSDKKSGAALGPDWYKHFDIVGSLKESNIKIHYETEVKAVERNGNTLKVTLSNDASLETDLIVSATGVMGNLNFETVVPFELSPDGCIKVNEFMETSVKGIYAAGDVCHCDWTHAPQWFPMKLWTQARQTGAYAARSISSCLVSEPVVPDFCFELFTHTTKLFGHKVILVGLYNGQKLDGDYEILFRTTKNVEYIKFVLKDNRLQGAVLIGETDLEETCENLILNKIDLTDFKADLLNPNVDIEDFFD